MADSVKDPVCGMDVDPEQAAQAEHHGTIFSFCCPACRDAFVADPDRYVQI